MLVSRTLSNLAFPSILTLSGSHFRPRRGPSPEGSGMVELPHLHGWQERGGWGRAGDSRRAPSAPAADLGASPFGRRPQPPLSCDLLLNHAFACASDLLQATSPTSFAVSTPI